MSFTIAQVKARVKRRLKLDPDTSTGDTQFDDMFLDFINDCHVLINTKLMLINKGWNETSADQNLVNGTDSYTIPATALMITSVFWKDGDVYRSIPEKQALRNTDYNPTDQNSGIYSWFFRDGSIVLRGAPLENKTNGLRVCYYPEITDNVAGDTVTDTNMIRSLYTLYCCKALRDSEGAQFNPFANEFFQLLKDWVEVMTRRYSGINSRDVYTEDGVLL